MGYMDGTHKYRICETNSNKVITSRGVVFTSLRQQAIARQKLCKYQTVILSRQQKCLYQNNGSFYNSPEFSKKHYDQSQTISMMMIRLIYNLLTNGIDPHLFSAHALLASTTAPQSYLQAHHSGEWEQ